MGRDGRGAEGWAGAGDSQEEVAGEEGLEPSIP